MTNTSYYAYWVEDEGVKADLAWSEGSFTDAEREQAARLSAAPGAGPRGFWWALCKSTRAVSPSAQGDAVQRLSSMTWRRR